MKELLIKTMKENREAILERLRNEIMSEYEIDECLDSLLEIEKFLKSLVE